MKKLALLLTVCLLAWSVLAGCQTQDTPQAPEPSGSEASASSTAQEGDPVVLCIEDSFEQDAYELENYLKATGVETEYEFLVLPNNTEDRETELTRLRTEIMAGRLYPKRYDSWLRHGPQHHGAHGSAVSQRGEKHVQPSVPGCGRDGAKQRNHRLGKL